MPINQSSLKLNLQVKSPINLNLQGSPLNTYSTSPVKTVKSQFTTINSIAELNDVTGTPSNGYTLVFNSTLNKYVVQQMSSENINILSIDGGTF